MSQFPFAPNSANEEVVQAKERAMKAFLSQYGQSLDDIAVRQTVLAVLRAEEAHATVLVDDAKARAATLRQALQERGIKLSLQKCLEGYARLCSYRNWSTFSAKLACGRPKGVHAAVRMLLDPSLDLEYITTRFGEWIEDRGVGVSGAALSDMLATRYDDSQAEDGSLIAGDPRLAMGSNEMSFIAQFEGKLGVLSEIELAFTIDEDIDPATLEDGRDSYGSIPLSKEAFAKTAEQYRQRTQAFVDSMGQKFGKSTFFLSTGFMERLCVCAFTPLDVMGPLSYASPYGSGDVTGQLEDALSTAIFGK